MDVFVTFHFSLDYLRTISSFFMDHLKMISSFCRLLKKVSSLGDRLKKISLFLWFTLRKYLINLMDC